MTDRHSEYPLDHFSRNIADEDLRGLVARHGVTYEIGPSQALDADREIVRRGWIVDLYGHSSPADAVLPSDAMIHHVHDVLHAVAATLVPEERRGLLDVRLEPFTGAVRLDPRHDFAKEVRLRIEIEPDTTVRMSMVDGADTAWRDEIVEKLEACGVLRH